MNRKMNHRNLSVYEKEYISFIFFALVIKKFPSMVMLTVKWSFVVHTQCAACFRAIHYLSTNQCCRLKRDHQDPKTLTNQTKQAKLQPSRANPVGPSPPISGVLRHFLQYANEIKYISNTASPGAAGQFSIQGKNLDLVLSTIIFLQML